MKSKKTISPWLVFLVLLMTNIQGFSQDLFHGKFEADSYFTTFEGHWKIVKKGEQHFVILADNFKAKKAPDLKIFLSKLAFDKINGDNAASETSSYFVAKLTQYKGGATYEIKGVPDLSQYKSIIIHCEEYSKLWGGSNLK